MSLDSLCLYQLTGFFICLALLEIGDNWFFFLEMLGLIQGSLLLGSFLFLFLLSTALVV